MSTTDKALGCSCQNIKFVVDTKPKDIAHCYCSICQNLHKKKYCGFAKYNFQYVKFDVSKLIEVKFSNRASRYKCSICGDYICMIYKNSDNIWLVIDLFKFDVQSIETYDIYNIQRFKD